MKDARGQIAIEFVIIVIVVVIYILAVVFPLGKTAADATEDASRVSLARSALDQVYSAAQNADNNPGDSYQQLVIVLPEKTLIQCNGTPSLTDLNFTTDLTPGLPVPPHCTPGTPPRCSFGYSFVQPAFSQNAQCNLATLTPRPSRYKKTITVKKTNGVLSITD